MSGVEIRAPDGIAPASVPLGRDVVIHMGRPVDEVVYQAAQARTRAKLADVTDPFLRDASRMIEVAIGLALYAGRGWDGVTLPGGAGAAPFDEAHIDAFFRSIGGAAAVFVLAVLGPLERLVTEGNG